MASRYQIVCMVVDRGSLKGAADELGYTQSAVSQAVKALERELGTTLIERGKQGVSLTRDGKQYLSYTPPKPFTFFRRSETRSAVSP